jgi:hypothetical protein
MQLGTAPYESMLIALGTGAKTYSTVLALNTKVCFKVAVYNRDGSALICSSWSAAKCITTPK